MSMIGWDQTNQSKIYLTEGFVIEFPVIDKNQCEIIPVEYNGNIYNCVKYTKIIEERLMKILPQRMEDFNDLYLTAFNFNYL